MDYMDEQDERQLRRKAIRWLLQQIKPRAIVTRLGRSLSWLKKWKLRFEQHGWAGLKSQSRAPRVAGQGYDARARQAVIAARRRLERRSVGLIGAKAIQREMEASGWKRAEIPSRATIKRILHDAGITGRTTDPSAYFPHPFSTANYRLQQLDWTEKVLEGGAKVYAFHTLDVDSRQMSQTLARDKRVTTVRQHLLKTWAILGIPDGMQLDNDAAFCGGYKVKRVFGACVRACLFVGVEPIFIPVREPKRNGLVERLNGLWSQSFWNRNHFRNFTHVQRAQPRFELWYTQTYLDAAVSEPAPCRRLTPQDILALPDAAALPITEGRVHFLRLVAADGTISLLNETWHISRRLAGKYVWATIITHEQRLSIYYKPSQHAHSRLLKEFKYEIPEPVQPLTARFQRVSKRRKMDTML
jgi:putative transposase